jgi:hypothetical protein
VFWIILATVLLSAYHRGNWTFSNEQTQWPPVFERTPCSWVRSGGGTVTCWGGTNRSIFLCKCPLSRFLLPFYHQACSFFQPPQCLLILSLLSIAIVLTLFQPFLLTYFYFLNFDLLQ